jgi:hypothetical protein
LAHPAATLIEWQLSKTMGNRACSILNAPLNPQPAEAPFSLSKAGKGTQVRILASVEINRKPVKAIRLEAI